MKQDNKKKFKKNGGISEIPIFYVYYRGYTLIRFYSSYAARRIDKFRVLKKKTGENKKHATNIGKRKRRGSLTESSIPIFYSSAT
jgi:hypothetical protein